MSNQWYEEVPANERLMQGDLILACPIATWDTENLEVQEQANNESERLTAAIKVIQADVVVMTQACDLVQDHVSNVTLCPHYSLAVFRESWEEKERASNQNPTEKNWKSTCDDLKEGFMWNLSLLNGGGTESLGTEHRVVDFYDVFTLPRPFLESLIAQRGTPRLRLLPPYREHLSQAFARFYMRVGLPTPVTRAW